MSAYAAGPSPNSRLPFLNLLPMSFPNFLPQRWTYSLQETQGASVEGDMLTVTMPGEYHICYEGEYNGREYSGIYALKVP